MSLEAHHQFIINTVMQHDEIARKFIHELEVENARLKTDYAALLAATQWRPIETAPKDGTHILAFHNGSIWTVWWSDTQMWHDSNDYDYRPTHWMPLPKPPSV